MQRGPVSKKPSTQQQHVLSPKLLSPNPVTEVHAPQARTQVGSTRAQSVRPVFPFIFLIKLFFSHPQIIKTELYERLFPS